MVGEALKRRGWREEPDPKAPFHSFIWKPFSKGMECEARLPFHGPILINHFECHSEITEKAKLFKNLKAFCESKR